MLTQRLSRRSFSPARDSRPPLPPVELYATSKTHHADPRTGQPFFTEHAYGLVRAMRQLPDPESWVIWQIGPVAIAYRHLFA
jgi:hypothetical protein